MMSLEHLCSKMFILQKTLMLKSIRLATLLNIYTIIFAKTHLVCLSFIKVILINEAIGIPAMAAHFFVFSFGIVADITPPVALAAYAGSAIPKAPPMRTAFNATSLAVAPFIVPSIFALNPAMLFIDAVWYQVVLICITSVIGIFGVAVGLSGFLYRHIPALLRVVTIVGGLTLLYPGVVTDFVGLILVGGVVVYQKMSAARVAE